MVSRPRTLSCLLFVEGATLLLGGGGLVVAAMNGDAAATLSTNGCAGVLALLVGPLLAWLCGALGVLMCLLGAAGLFAGRAARRRRLSSGARGVLVAYALSWAVLAAIACLRVGAPQCDVATNCAAGGLAAAIALVHWFAARSRAPGGVVVAAA